MKRPTKIQRRILARMRRAYDALVSVIELDGEIESDDVAEAVGDADDELEEAIQWAEQEFGDEGADDVQDVDAALRANASEVKRAHDRIDAARSELVDEARRLRESFNTFAAEGRAAISQCEKVVRHLDVEQASRTLRTLAEALEAKLRKEAASSAIGDARAELSSLRGQINELAAEVARLRTYYAETAANVDELAETVKGKTAS